MTATLTIKTKVAGVLTDVTSVVLENPDATFGIERASDSAVIVAAGTVMTHSATGTYTYTFDADDGVYNWWAKVTYGGNTYYLERKCVMTTYAGALNVLADSPADVLAAYLLAAGITTDRVAAEDWSTYVSHMPETPDNAVALYDTSPLKDGRMRDDTVVHHFSVQVLVRSRVRSTGWSKMQVIAGSMDTIDRNVVTCNGTDYQIQAVTRASGPTDLGEEEESSKKRRLFTLNVVFPMEVA